MASSYGDFHDCTSASDVSGVTCTTSDSNGTAFLFDFTNLPAVSALDFTVDFGTIAPPSFAAFIDDGTTPPPTFAVVSGCTDQMPFTCPDSGNIDIASQGPAVEIGNHFFQRFLLTDSDAGGLGGVVDNAGPNGSVTVAFDFGDVDANAPDVTSIGMPEPGSFAMLSVGAVLGLLGLSRRRRNRLG